MLFVFIFSLKLLELVSLQRESCKHSREWASRHSILSILISSAGEGNLLSLLNQIDLTSICLKISSINKYNKHILIGLVFLPLWELSKFFLINVSWFLSFYTSTSSWQNSIIFIKLLVSSNYSQGWRWYWQMFTYLLWRNETDIKLTFAQSNLTLLVVFKTKNFVQVLMMNR